MLKFNRLTVILYELEYDSKPMHNKQLLYILVLSKEKASLRELHSHKEDILI